MLFMGRKFSFGFLATKLCIRLLSFVLIFLSVEKIYDWILDMSCFVKVS
jgi:phosphoglycerol transferase MdoB-like AlkP superfamily enzyme